MKFIGWFFIIFCIIYSITFCIFDPEVLVFFQDTEKVSKALGTLITSRGMFIFSIGMLFICTTGLVSLFTSNIEYVKNGIFLGAVSILTLMFWDIMMDMNF
ncbi:MULTISPECIES: hypothetical protein [Bacillus]|uniref:hypothetical protein n=1 Tax=Bacillus TaxID=1386 RepID=UPI000BFCE754|nr:MULTISPECIES: hypothetical protein [Bacillus]MEB9857285.1 hypothetical protein [Bacillus cereus]MEB9891969.1 hypothetical protein [Bacillus cereus]PHA86163.1 hypothetical protein COE77_18110 [Bacillus toyonensis]